MYRARSFHPYRSLEKWLKSGDTRIPSVEKLDGGTGKGLEAIGTPWLFYPLNLVEKKKANKLLLRSSSITIENSPQEAQLFMAVFYL